MLYTPKPKTIPTLTFASFTSADIEIIRPMLAMSGARTCDFTIGGIYLWQGYFMYSRAIVDDTLFIKGMAEDNLDMTAFSLPVGKMDLRDSLSLLKSYCRQQGLKPLLSAVPETRIDDIMKAAEIESVTELPDWTDYLYEIGPMATFQGRKMSKKRNHVNRFMADHPDAVFEPLTVDNIPAALDFLERHSKLSPDKSITADYDIMETAEALRSYGDFNYEGAILRVPDAGVVAFTIGEVLGDTLYVHIEKMDHDVSGSGETVSSKFCEMMIERHPELKFVNREDSSGDPGLARAKESYHPIELLRKYNVLLRS